MHWQTLLEPVILAQAQSAAPVWEKLLHPGILALAIPILAIFFWGLNGTMRTMRGEPDEFEDWKSELEHLRTRVEALERASQASHQAEQRR